MTRPLPLLLLLAACSSSSTSIVILNQFPAKAEREVVLALPEAPGKTLKLATSFGAVRVRAADGPAEVRVRLTLHARTEEEARELLAGFDVVLDETAAALAVRRTGEPVRIDGTNVEPVLAFRATVRPGRKLKVETGSGAIEVVGGAGDCALETSFGDVLLAGARGERMSVKTGSGGVRLEDVEARRIDVTTSFGAVRLHDVGGALTAHTGSGDIDVRGFRGGSCALTTSFGAVEARGVFTALLARTGSGDVHVEAEPGSRPERAWTLTTSFGAVDLALPPGFGCELRAQTSFGTIRNDLDLAGAEVGERSVAGTCGVGGGSVAIETGSGDVRLRRLGVPEAFDVRR